MSLPQSILTPRSVELLPHFMQDDTTNGAFCDSIDDLVMAPANDADALSVWGYVERLTSDQLDELAWELEIDWWDGSATLAQKRATIQTARQIKNHRGTVYAVKQVVENAFDSGEVQQWYEYGGDPKHFRIVANTTPPDLETLAVFREQVMRAKPASAILDNIEFSGLDLVVSSQIGAAGIGAAIVTVTEAAGPEE